MIRVRALGSSGIAYALLVVVGAVSLWRSPELSTFSGLAGVAGLAAPLILAAMALVPIALVGDGVDLAIGPLVIFVNVVLVQQLFASGINAPLTTVAAALLLGAVVQLITAAVIIGTRIDPVIVSLGVFLILTGLNVVILPQPGGSVPPWLRSWGASTELISGPVLLIVALALLWWLFSHSALYVQMRQVGSDERTAWASGVPVIPVKVAAHIVSGLFAGGAGLAYTGLVASGNSSQSTNYTLLAVTAVVIGGVALNGGAGRMATAAVAALDVFLVSYVLSTFNFGVLASYVNQLVYGTVLVVVMVALPALGRLGSRSPAHRKVHA